MLLSGGVDSAGLDALAAGEPAEPVEDLLDRLRGGELRRARRARLVAERYCTDHHELVLRPDAAELLPRLVEAFDEPFGDSSAVPTYLVSQLAAGEVKVALSGEGGDELFGGYYTYVADLWRRGWRRWPPSPRRWSRRCPAPTSKVSLDYKAKRFDRGARLPPLERHHAWKEIFSARRGPPCSARAIRLGPGRPLRERYAETAGAEPLARLQDLDLGIYLVDDLLVKTDRSSMAHSLELRVPFLDQRVAAFALGLATPLKVRGLAKKRLLRRALAPLLPKEVLRGPKQGFSIPLAAWLRGPLGFARRRLGGDPRRGRAGSTPRPSPRSSTATAPAARTSAASSGG